MVLAPYLRTPFTDLTGAVLSSQWYGRCKDTELKMLDCLEAYGLERGQRECALLMKDLQECGIRAKQTKRADYMMWERTRQYWMGERTKENRYAPGPPPDSF